LEIRLAPTFGGSAKTTAYDFGFLVRFSPLELAPSIRDVVGLDLAYGWSELSFESDPVFFANEDEPAEVSQHDRRGFAGRIRLDWPGMAESMAGPEWLWKGFSPLLSVGLANDHSSIGPPGGTYDTEGVGWELTVANVFSLRRGHYEDFVGSIIDDTEGWGVGLPIGDVAGVRYDFARFPQARNSGLPDVERRAASGWVDVIRVWRLMRP